MAQRHVARHCTFGVNRTLHRTRLKRLVTGLGIILVLLAVLGWSSAAVAQTALAAQRVRRPAAAVADDWPTYLHDLTRSDASADTTLSTANVAQLTPLWSYHTGGIIAASPTVVGGVAYVGSWDGYEYAFNASTGVLLWRIYLGITTASPTCFPSQMGISSVAAVQGGVVYVGGGDAYWYALDSSTGAVLWRVFTGDNSATGGHYNWSSPLIYNGFAYVGVASVGDCPLVQGQLLKVDLSAHQVVATLNVVPTGQLGGGIWTSPALDTATGTIYVTTGTLNDPSQTYSQALVAVDANTLAITSAWQVPQNQVVPDSDWGTTPVLFSDSSGRQLVAATNKNGYVYTFLRSNVAAGPIWRRQVAFGGLCPTCGDGSVSSMVFANGLLYTAGGNTTINGVGYPGAVRALDPATGNAVWEHGDPGPIVPALAYDNGLVIAGTGNTLEALDASSGTRLYSFPTATQLALFGPASVAHGTLFFGSADGTVYALALPSAPPAAPPDANCPAGWTCQDIGAPTPSGSETVSGATWTISAGGAGIAGASDQMRLLTQTTTGDTQITAQISTPQSSSASAQTGLMLRQSADPASPYYTVIVESNNTLAVQARTGFGATASLLNSVTLPASPLYLEIQRTGDVFQAATSTDGSTYTLVPGSTRTLAMPDSVLTGVAATSGASSTLATSAVSGAQIAAPSTSPLPVPPASACPTGWSCQDVGNPLSVGNQTLSGTTWTLSAGGSDIYGYGDQFHYVWQSLPGNGAISSAITSQSNTSPSAKVGLMFRQSPSPAAAYYAAFITPGNGIVVQYRTVGGLNTTVLTSVAGAVPLCLQISRYGNAYSAYESVDGATWTYIAGSTVVVPLGSTVLAGLAISSHNTTTAGSATINAVTLTNTGTPPPPGCPSGWSCGDIGSPYLAGSESYASGSWYIQAAGNDIWNTSDEFHFDWQTLAGDGTLSARVSQQSDSDPWAKAGVMLRLSTDPAAPFYDVVITPANGVAVQYRATAGAAAAEASDVSATAPLFLRIGRTGTTFSASTSPDGVTWTLVPASTVSISSLAGGLLAGMATTSHNITMLGQVAFDSIAFDTCAAGWSCQDIGNPLPAGTQSSSAGVWTIQGAGGDIWGTSDQFHYAWQPLTADGSISVHIMSQTNTSAWAKAGVMLRTSTDAAAPFYDVVVTPANGVSVQYRSTAGGSAQQPANIPGFTVPIYLRIARSSTTFAAYSSSDGVTWTLVSNSTVSIPTLSGTLLAGMAITSHNNGTLSTATVDSVALSTCPAGWTCADVGGPTPAGSESATGAAWTVSGSGGDIWGTSDQFHFDAQPLAGDGTLSAQVTAQTNTSSWAKAGVMVRASTDPGAPFYDVVVTPANGVSVQYRATASASAQQPVNLAGTTPLYLRLTRSGTTFSAFTSADGVTWTLVPNSTVTIPALAGTILAGLAVTAHNNGTLSTATFAAVSISPCPSGWSCADIGAPALAGAQSLSGGVWTISGGGSDIWGTSDYFHYVWQSLAADGSISEHVAGQTNTSAWAKAGLMLRLSTDPGAPFYDVVVTPANGVSVQYRASAGGSAQQAVNLSGLTVPIYLRITRSGTTYSAATSSDGVTWTPIPGSTVSIPALSGSLLAGLAVTAHNNSALSIATFDTVTMPATSTTASGSAPAPATGTLVSPLPVLPARIYGVLF